MCSEINRMIINLNESIKKTKKMKIPTSTMRHSPQTELHKQMSTRIDHKTPSEQGWNFL